jgi:hypothetical protein
MDDISKRRLESAVVEGNGRMDGVIGAMREGCPVDAINDEMRALGVPPEADLVYGFQWIGFVIGNMVQHAQLAADCHLLLNAVSGLSYNDAYDICTDDKVAAELEAIAATDGLEAETVYRWGRFMRVGLCEIVFALEDHFSLLGQHPGVADLQERAISAVSLLIDTMHPAFEAAHRQAQ